MGHLKWQAKAIYFQILKTSQINLFKRDNLQSVIGRCKRLTVRLTLIRESWKKNPKRGTITERLLRKKNPERSIEKICICFCAVDFFPKMTLGHGPEKWHIFLFNTAYFLSYWQMPFEINTIEYPN